MRTLSPGGGRLALVSSQLASMRIPDFSDPGALLFLKSIPYSELNSLLFLFFTITICIPYTNMHVSALTPKQLHFKDRTTFSDSIQMYTRSFIGLRVLCLETAVSLNAWVAFL